MTENLPTRVFIHQEKSAHFCDETVRRSGSTRTVDSASRKGSIGTSIQREMTIEGGKEHVHVPHEHGRTPGHDSELNWSRDLIRCGIKPHRSAWSKQRIHKAKRLSVSEKAAFSSFVMGLILIISLILSSESRATLQKARNLHRPRQPWLVGARYISDASEETWGPCRKPVRLPVGHYLLDGKEFEVTCSEMENIPGWLPYTCREDGVIELHVPVVNFYRPATSNERMPSNDFMTERFRRQGFLNPSQGNDCLLACYYVHYQMLEPSHENWSHFVRVNRTLRGSMHGLLDAKDYVIKYNGRSVDTRKTIRITYEGETSAAQKLRELFVKYDREIRIRGKHATLWNLRSRTITPGPNEQPEVVNEEEMVDMHFRGSGYLRCPGEEEETELNERTVANTNANLAFPEVVADDNDGSPEITLAESVPLAYVLTDTEDRSSSSISLPSLEHQHKLGLSFDLNVPRVFVFERDSFVIVKEKLNCEPKAPHQSKLTILGDEDHVARVLHHTTCTSEEHWVPWSVFLKANQMDTFAMTTYGLFDRQLKLTHECINSAIPALTDPMTKCLFVFRVEYSKNATFPGWWGWVMQSPHFHSYEMNMSTARYSKVAMNETRLNKLLVREAQTRAIRWYITWFLAVSLCLHFVEFTWDTVSLNASPSSSGAVYTVVSVATSRPLHMALYWLVHNHVITALFIATFAATYGYFNTPVYVGTQAKPQQRTHMWGYVHPPTENNPGVVQVRVGKRKNSPPQPMAARLPCAIPGVAPFVPDLSSLDNVLVGLNNRIGKPMPKPAAEDLRSLRAFVAAFCVEYIRPLTSADVPPTIEWINGLPKSRGYKEKLLDAHNRDEGNCEVVNVFIKDEKYLVAGKAPRLIMARTDKFKTICGPVFSAIEKEVFRLDWIYKKYAKEHTAEARLMSLAGEGFHFVETDYTSFECSFSPEIMENCEFVLYDHMTRGLDVRMPYIKNVLAGTNHLKSRLGATATVRGRRMSGEMNTSLGNTFSNLMFMLWNLDQHGLPWRQAEMLVEGDDCICALKEPITVKPIERLGLIIKFEQFNDPTLASFCGMRMLPNGTRAKDPTKLLLTGWTSRQFALSKPAVLAALQTMKALSGIYMHPGCPMITAFYRDAIDPALTSKAVELAKKDRGLYNIHMDYSLLGSHEEVPITDADRETFCGMYGYTPEEQIRFEKGDRSVLRVDPSLMEQWALYVQDRHG